MHIAYNYMFYAQSTYAVMATMHYEFSKKFLKPAWVAVLPHYEGSALLPPDK